MTPAAFSYAGRRSPMWVRLVGVLGVIWLGLAAVSIATGIHLWQRSAERFTCPTGTRLDLGAWADASLCVSPTGAANLPSTRSVGWWEPAWSALLLAGIILSVIAGGLWLVRAIWRR